MLDIFEINRLAGEAASATLRGVRLGRVETHPTTDSDGRDALHITIVLESGYDEVLSGDAALDALVRIQDDLQDAGEERLAMVDFTTDAELNSDGDS